MIAFGYKLLLAYSCTTCGAKRNEHCHRIGTSRRYEYFTHQARHDKALISMRKHVVAKQAA